MLVRSHRSHDRYLWIKSIAGVSVAAVATFNVVADKAFSLAPSDQLNLLAAVIGALLGALLASKA